MGRNPLAFSLAYNSLNAPEEETWEKPPYGYVKGGVGTVSRAMAEARLPVHRSAAQPPTAPLAGRPAGSD